MKKGRIGDFERRMVVVPVEDTRIVPWWPMDGWSLQNQGRAMVVSKLLLENGQFSRVARMLNMFVGDSWPFVVGRQDTWQFGETLCQEAKVQGSPHHHRRR